jgi:CO dehydrogenase maturation factor
LSVIGDKVIDPADVGFLRPRDRRRTVGLPYVFAVVRAMEQGNRFEVENLEPANRHALNRTLDTVDAAVRDPPPFLAFPRKP